MRGLSNFPEGAAEIREYLRADPHRGLSVTQYELKGYLRTILICAFKMRCLQADVGKVCVTGETSVQTEGQPSASKSTLLTWERTKTSFCFSWFEVETA